MGQPVIRPRGSKTIDFYGIGFDEMDGTVEAITAVTGVVDLVDERVQPGAFAKTIADNRKNFGRIPMGVDHEIGVGVTTDMQEIGRSDLPREIRSEYPEATGGLYCKGQVSMSDTNAKMLQRVNADIAAGKPIGSSFVYEVFRDAKAVEGHKRVRDLLELGVMEWTIAQKKRPVNPAARVTGVKATDDAKAIAGSYEHLSEDIMDAVRAAGLVPDNGWGYVVATFPTHAIVSLSAPDVPVLTLQVDWTMLSGQVVLGGFTEVDVEQVVVPATAKALEVVELTALVERYSREFKAGRVLSGLNLDDLDAAIAKLQSIRERAASTADTEGTAGESDAPAAKAVTAADEPPRDLTMLGVELAILETEFSLLSAA